MEYVRSTRDRQIIAERQPKKPTGRPIKRPQPSEFPAMDTRAYLLGEAEYFSRAGCVLVWIGNPIAGVYTAFEAWEPQEGGKKLATINIGK